MDIRSILYARISEDDTGLEEGVTRQLADARDLAAARGWTVLDEFSDNDISALSGARREGYEALLRAVASGGVDKIVVFHTSRLWRNRAERAHGIERLAAAGVGIVAVKGPDLDLDSAYGRGLAGLLGEFDTLESEIKAERVAQAARQRAEEGRANGKVAYGWQRVYTRDDRDRVTGFEDIEDLAEAAVVREIVGRLLSGESLHAITESLNARRVPAPGAGQRRNRGLGQDADGTLWNKTSVKKIALRPANVAIRTHVGVEYPAAWPALISRERHERVKALLTDPARSVRRDGARKHLLTWGIGECGKCGGALRVARRGNSRRGTKKELYVCDDGCVGRDERYVDELVSGVVVERLSRADAAEIFAGHDQAAAEAIAKAEELRARLDLAADDYAAGILTRSQLHRVTAGLRPQIEAAERRARDLRPALDMSLLDVAGEHAAEAWEQLDVAQRRTVLDVLGLRVVILPTMRRGPGFDPETVRVEWTGAASPLCGTCIGPPPSSNGRCGRSAARTCRVASRWCACFAAGAGAQSRPSSLTPTARFSPFGASAVSPARTPFDAMDHLVAVASAPVLASLPLGSEAMNEQWRGFGHDRRRAIVDVLMTVTVLPVRCGRPPGHVPGTGYFDPQAVSIDWR
ncbi:recombinase family protein [Streptomyces sp. NPDC005386]|uniref:recombinase family protein n=1 Tax=Streptomyces sp. NPDC005386 TaxID=3154562 RepID=UPI0033A39994